MVGRLEVICGSMFSGKTEELMRRLRRAEYAKQTVLTLKHHIDDRKSYACIVSHNGNERMAYPVDGTEEGMSQLLKMADSSVDVIGIDEIQFFPIEILPAVEELIAAGKRVVVSGLDLDFRGEPFGCISHLMAIADHVVKLRAICMQCGQDANFTQRLINGQPAKYDDPTILVGAEECYEARCRACYLAPHQVMV